LAQDKPIQLCYSAWPGWWPWYIAEKEKLFEANGVNVKLVWFDDYTGSMEAFAGGTLDGCAQTLNDTISFEGAAQQAGFNEVVVLVNDNSAGNDKIIVTKDIKSINDLIGKKVAIEVGVVDDFLLSLALKDAGHSRKDVNIVPLSTGDAATAFYAGKADAVGAFPPFWTTALKRDGSHELLSSTNYPGAIPDLLVLKSTLIKDNPKAVQALVKTWWDVIAFIKDNPEQATKDLIERAGVSADEFNLYQKGTRFFSVKDNLEAFSEGNTMVNMPYAAKQMAQFMLDVGFIKSIPDMSGLFDDSFIKAYAAANPPVSTEASTAASTEASK
jgi:NitT/TauT family transport system substrate-binding protein